MLEEIRRELRDLRPSCPDDVRECSECFEDGCRAVQRVEAMLTSSLTVCMCHGEDTPDGHRVTCYLGERGKKLRRRIEDRLRKDNQLMRDVAALLSIEG